MSQGKWACRPTPRRKSLQQVVAERRKARAKQWEWLQKQGLATIPGLFVTYAEPSERAKEEAVEERQGE